MRKIKFRGKDIDSGEWAKGDLTKLYYPEKLCITQKGDNQNWANTRFIEVLPETVGQSTGLTDKDGEDLDWWEGDVIKKDNGCLAEIISHNGCFMGRWIGRNDMPLFYFNHYAQHPEWFEVIGNRFDNPELMEPKNEADVT